MSVQPVGSVGADARATERFSLKIHAAYVKRRTKNELRLAVPSCHGELVKHQILI